MSSIFSEKYGDVFKNLRLQKNISLSRLSKLSSVSKATISQFENGNSMVSYEKLERMLEVLHLTLLDYSLIINNGTPEYFIAKFQEIETAYYNNDLNTLAYLYESCAAYPELEYIALSAKSAYKCLSDIEILSIKKFFSNNPFWGQFEFYVLIHTIEQLPIDYVWLTIKKIFEDPFIKSYFTVLHEYRALIINIIIKACLVFIQGNDEDKATITLQNLKQLSSNSDLTTLIILEILEGSFIYKFHDKTKGSDIIDKMLYTMTELNAIKLRDSIKRRIEKLLIDE